MKQASITGVFEVIFWIIAVSFIIRLVARLAVPYVVKKSAEHMQQRMKDFQQSQQRASRKEGEVTIENKTAKPGGASAQQGDYVDYVEVKE